MANPAILVGLIVGYTVGAVVTALAVAHDDPASDLPAAPALVATSRATGVCARIAGNRRVARCLHSFDASRTLSSPRR